MRLTTTSDSAAAVKSDAVVVGCYAEGVLSVAATELNDAAGGVLRRLIEAKEITGKPNELTSIFAPHGVAATQVLVVGLGEKDKLDRAGVFRAAAAAAKSLAGKPRRRVAYYLADRWPADWVEAGACGALVGCQGQDLYRAEKKLTPFEEVLWSGGDAATLATAQQLADSMNLTRRLVNEPPSAMYPEVFARTAQDVAAECGFECEVWDQPRLEAERCGALLAVARGSARAPRLVILNYRGAAAGAPILGLIGKGVTFDSGGLSLKPTDSMTTMKCDMAGAATVLGALRAIASLKLPVHVMGFVGLVENMISGDSYKLGDVLTARSGKTIEVLNTDAEGRIVLADVLDVAVERGAAKLIDLATLTGACVVALGVDVAGLMTNDQGWCDSVIAAARECGERVWQLPMFPEYAEQIKSKVADIKNVGEGRWGGAITAGKFLEEFVQEKPWVHIDIAGPAFLESAKPWLDAGGSGALVRTLVEVAKQWR